MDCHLSLLRALNELNFQVNAIIMDAVNIHKFAAIRLGDGYQPLSILPSADYNMLALKVRTLRSYLEGSYQSNHSKFRSADHYYDQILKASMTILDANKFISIGTDFARASIDYYYLINENLRLEYTKLEKFLSEATTRNMEGFDIEEYKRRIIKFIKETNDAIAVLR